MLWTEWKFTRNFIIILLLWMHWQTGSVYWPEDTACEIKIKNEQFNFNTYSEQMVNALLHVIHCVSVYGSFETTTKNVAPSFAQINCSHVHWYGSIHQKMLHAVQLWSLYRHDTMQSSYSVYCGSTFECECVWVFIETERFSQFQFYFSSVCANSVTYCA